MKRFVFIASLATAGLLSSSGALALGPLKGGGPKRSVEIKGSMEPKGVVKVDVISVSVQPQQPKAGEAVTVTLTVGNSGDRPVKNVSWGIYCATEKLMLAAGEQSEVTPGGGFTKTASWTAKTGTHAFQGFIGPKAVLEKPAAFPGMIGNVTLNVPERALVPGKANAASTFSLNRPAGTPEKHQSLSQGNDISRIKIDIHDVKINGKDPANNGQRQGIQHDSGVRGIGAGDSHKQQSDDLKKKQAAAAAKQKPFIGENPIKGAKFADSFGGTRINSRYGAQDTHNYRGDGKERAGKEPNETTALELGLVNVQVKENGKNGYKGNSYYFAGSDGKSRVRLQYSEAGNLREYTYMKMDDPKQPVTTTKYDEEGNVVPDKRPNPNADDAGGGIVLTREKTVDQTLKAGMKTGGKAGGPDDGRNPEGGNTSGADLGAGTAIMMGQTHGQESKQVEGGGTVNINEVLKINEVVNPGSQ